MCGKLPGDRPLFGAAAMGDVVFDLRVIGPDPAAWWSAASGDRRGMSGLAFIVSSSRSFFWVCMDSSLFSDSWCKSDSDGLFNWLLSARSVLPLPRLTGGVEKPGAGVSTRCMPPPLPRDTRGDRIIPGDGGASMTLPGDLPPSEMGWLRMGRESGAKPSSKLTVFVPRPLVENCGGSMPSSTLTTGIFGELTFPLATDDALSTLFCRERLFRRECPVCGDALSLVTVGKCLLSSFIMTLVVAGQERPQRQSRCTVSNSPITICCSSTMACISSIYDKTHNKAEHDFSGVVSQFHTQNPCIVMHNNLYLCCTIIYLKHACSSGVCNT